MNLEAVYPDAGDPSVELSFEELRATSRGLDNIDWSTVPRDANAESVICEVVRQSSPAIPITATTTLDIEVPPAKKKLSIFEDHEQMDAPKPILVEDKENAPIGPTAEPAPHHERGFAIFHDQTENKQVAEQQERPAPPITIDSSLKVVPLNDENDENKPPAQRDADLAKRMRREERANRTRKIKVMEVEHVQKETQTGPYRPQLLAATRANIAK